MDVNKLQIEAIAVADAHTSNAALPTYSELLAELTALRGACVREVHPDGYTMLQEPSRKAFNDAGVLIARVNFQRVSEAPATNDLPGASPSM